MQNTKGNYFLTWPLVIHHHSVANHHSSKFGKVMDTCLSSTILLWPSFSEFLQLFYLHFVEYFFGLVFLLGFFTDVEKKSEGRCFHEGVFFFFLGRPDPQVFGTPKSSSVAEGRQDFHLHTIGFGTQTLFRGPRVPERDYTTKPSPLGYFHKVFGLD